VPPHLLHHLGKLQRGRVALEVQLQLLGVLLLLPLVPLLLEALGAGIQHLEQPSLPRPLDQASVHRSRLQASLAQALPRLALEAPAPLVQRRRLVQQQPPRLLQLLRLVVDRRSGQVGLEHQARLQHLDPQQLQHLEPQALHLRLGPILQVVLDQQVLGPQAEAPLAAPDCHLVGQQLQVPVHVRFPTAKPLITILPAALLVLAVSSKMSTSIPSAPWSTTRTSSLRNCAGKTMRPV